MVRVAFLVSVLFVLVSIYCILGDLHIVPASSRLWAGGLYCLCWASFNLYRGPETRAWRKANPFWMRALLITPVLLLVLILGWFGLAQMAARFPITAFVTHLIALPISFILLFWAAVRRWPAKSLAT